MPIETDNKYSYSDKRVDANLPNLSKQEFRYQISAHYLILLGLYNFNQNQLFVCHYLTQLCSCMKGGKRIGWYTSFQNLWFYPYCFNPCHHHCYHFLEIRRSADEGCQQIKRCFSKLANQQIRRCFSKLALPGREGRRSLLELLGPMSDPAKRSKNAKVARNWEIESGN